MPEPGRTSSHRKVYIATGKDAAAKESTFGILGGDFDYRTTAPEEAEFIVVDCQDFVAPRQWLNARPELVITKPCRPPVLLVLFGDQLSENIRQTLEAAYDGDVSALPKAREPEQLLPTLKWLQESLPFYNRTNAPPVMHEAALAVLKSLLAAKD